MSVVSDPSIRSGACTRIMGGSIVITPTDARPSPLVLPNEVHSRTLGPVFSLQETLRMGL